MKTLLRKIGGQFLQAPDLWTNNLQDALDFKSMRRAIDFAENAGYRNMELAFLFDNPHRLETARVDTLLGMEM